MDDAGIVHSCRLGLDRGGGRTQPVRMSRSEQPEAAVRVARRAWVPSAQAADLAGRCAAVLDSSAQDTVIASSTAARLRGLWLPDASTSDSCGDRDARARGAADDAQSETRTDRAPLPAAACDYAMVDGLLVTSIARTWRDLASVLSLPDLVAAGDSALRPGVTREELVDVLRASSRRHNAKRATRRSSCWTSDRDHVRRAICAWRSADRTCRGSR